VPLEGCEDQCHLCPRVILELEKGSSCFANGGQSSGPENHQASFILGVDRLCDLKKVINLYMQPILFQRQKVHPPQLLSFL
jgi:hypothetical protein